MGWRWAWHLPCLADSAVLASWLIPRSPRSDVPASTAGERSAPESGPAFTSPTGLPTRKLEDRGRLILLPRLQHRRGKSGMVGRVGEMLGLQTETIAKVVDLSAFSLNRPIEEVPAVKLNARLVG